MLLVLLIPEDDQDVTEAQDYLTSFFFFFLNRSPHGNNNPLCYKTTSNIYRRLRVNKYHTN